MDIFPFNKLEVVMLGQSQREQKVAWDTFISKSEEAGMEVIKNRDPLALLCDQQLLFGSSEDFSRLVKQTKDSMEALCNSSNA